jgi:Cu(I)/Ag(I) efflux system membrane fusion protein
LRGKVRMGVQVNPHLNPPPRVGEEINREDTEMINRKKMLKIASVFIVIIFVAIVLYKFGYKIPVLNEIPLFSKGHEHQYRPVLSEEGNIEYWTCTMHPSVKLTDPGTCPICKMDLVPVMKKQTSDEEKPREKMNGMQGMHNMPGMDMGKSASDKQGMETSSAFIVSPERQQIIGVKTEPVTIRDITKVIRTVGMVVLDETKIEQIHTKINGWIEKVFVDYTWQHVKKGDPLFSIYSPELVSTQEEYLLALKSKRILGDSKFVEISDSANSLLEASKRRLELWDISEQQIRDLEQTGKVKKSLVIYSPISGHVMYKNAFENMFVEPNTIIYKVADHSTVWVNADIYENEISLVKLGQEASITVASLPGQVFTGKVTFIWPHLEPETRTTKVRMEFPNTDLKLLPEMYANVEIEIPLGERLTIPTSAVLRTGKQDVVFLDMGEGKMQIRRVGLGQKVDDYYEVLRGLNEGDAVVSRASFLIDAESQIQAAVANWGENTSEKNEPTYEMEFEKEPGKVQEPSPRHIH